MFIASVTVSPWAANCYLAGPDEGQECVVIDPGITGLQAIIAELERHQRQPVAIIGTHGHLDHVGDAASLAKRYRIPVYLHPLDQGMLTHPAEGLGPAAIPLLIQLLGSQTLPAPEVVRPLVEGEDLTLAGITFSCIHAPGHTKGSTLLSCAGENVVFSGDVLFAGAIGRMDLPGGSISEMHNTIFEVLPKLPNESSIYPGHGPATTLAQEWATNPYLQPETWK